MRGWHKQMEFADLIAVCQGLIAGAARLVPKLLRAPAHWIETAVATGRTDLDEALAQLLRGQ
ncbi:DUF6192 family protein [Streptomyces nigra]|uniref:DUF6192 family protein n=1 Tax=Streptomyces nigra TaxID=1827580 RepID=UPI0034541BB3